MTAEQAWKQCLDLVDKVLGVTSGVELGQETQWHALVTLALSQSNKRLHSIRLLLEATDLDSAIILTRSLFELAANLVYINLDQSPRLSEYLRHAGIPIFPEEIEASKKRTQADSPRLNWSDVPKWPWRRLKVICDTLGEPWPHHYATVYRYASIPTHAGAFTLGRAYFELMERQSAPDSIRTTTLVIALAFHLQIGRVAAGTFAAQIDLDEVEGLVTEVRTLGGSLVRGTSPA